MLVLVLLKAFRIYALFYFRVNGQDNATDPRNQLCMTYPLVKSKVMNKKLFFCGCDIVLTKAYKIVISDLNVQRV
jgi:hypothetical protein